MDAEGDQGRVRGAAPRLGVPPLTRRGGALALGGRLDRRHERDARGDDPAALLVRRRRLARARADAHAWRSWRVAKRRSARSKPEPYWLVDATFQPVSGEAGRKYDGRFRAGPEPAVWATEPQARGPRFVDGGPRAARWRDLAKVRRRRRVREKAPLLLRPDVVAARRPTRATASRRAATLSAAQRLYEEHNGAHLPAYELTLPVERHGRRDQADGRAGRRGARVRRRGALRDRSGRPPPSAA